ncbi:Ig-like domain-containing protein [Rothia sp. LK2588]|uniref:L,D-transpeptidase n=1 Tax=Rothia sp. LK2588 TaxID=3114369 RepID=UPI0034CF1A52
MRPNDSTENEPGRLQRRVISRRPLLAASFSTVSLAVLSACSSSNNSSGGGSSTSASPTNTPEASASATPTEKKFSGSITMDPQDGATEINPVKNATVTAKNAKLTQVQLSTAGEDGSPIPTAGKLSADGTSWTNTDPLEFNTAYDVHWEATDDTGVKESGDFTFSTVTPANQADYGVNITEGKQYGVGMIPEFIFSEPVKNKDAVEKALSVTAGGKPVKVACRWYSDRKMRLRPAEYWPANSTIVITGKTRGVDFGGGMICNSDLTRTFTTGDKHTALADDKTKTIKLFVNDKLVHENPVTLGNPDWPSVVGKLVVLEQSEKYKFDPTSLKLEPGDSHWYEPFYATNVSRLTGSGVFVHQALPTAYSSVGVANVSHGCIGMLPDDAKYFFDLFDVGDVVETINTGYPQADPDDGLGDWNIPFSHYANEKWKGNW